MARKNKRDRGIRVDDQGRYWVDFYHDGRRVRRRADNKTEAEKLYRRLRSDLERGQAIDPGRRGFQAEAATVAADETFTLLHLWNRYLKLRDKIRSLVDARRHLGCFVAHHGEDRPAGSLRPGDIELWLAAEAGRTSNSSANRALHTIRAAFRLALRDGYIERDPTVGVRVLPEPSGRTRYLTQDEEKRLSEHLVGRDWRIVQVAIFTGLRRGNIFELRWEQIDWSGGVIVIPRTKSGRRHVVPITAALRAVLMEQRSVVAEGPWVWPSERRPGDHLDAERWCKSYLKPALESARVVDFRFHDLRHTTGTRITMAGHGPMVVRDMLGHSSVTVSQRSLAPGARVPAGGGRVGFGSGPRARTDTFIDTKRKQRLR